MSIRPQAFLLALCLALALTACSGRPRSTADVPRVLPASYQIAVAPFNQPINTTQLIAGRIPENQGRIQQEDLLALDERLRSVLSANTKRAYTFPAGKDAKIDITAFHSSEQPQALPLWVAYGKKMGAQLILVPQVMDWHEREGSKGGVTQSAHVRLEFFLLRVEDGTLMNRSVFEEKQVGLTENLMTVGSFFKRGGAWVSAGDLSQDAMAKAVQELGL